MSQLQPPEEFPFPFPPYNIQTDFMRKLFSVLEEGQLGIFESPTGTGKSLSLICGALTWLKQHADHHKAELIRKIEESKSTQDDDGPDWFTAATKRIESKEEARRCQEQLQLLEKQEERICALRKGTKAVKNKKIQNLNNEFDELFRDLHHVQEDLRRELNAVNGEDTLPSEEQTLLLDEYNSDDDDDGEERREGEQEQDQGCLKIFYCSRTHSQLSQFVREIQKTVYGEEARVVSLASRQNLCVNEAVNKLSNISLMNDRCVELRKGKKGKTTKQTQDGTSVKKKRTTSGCPYYQHTAVEELADQVLLEVQDIEQLVGLGRKMNSCPYYATRAAIRDAQVVVLPYNTLLHRRTRESYGINLSGNVVVVDEAHNLLETISNIHSVFVSLRQLQGAHAQLSQYLQRYSSRLSPTNLLYLKQILFFMHAIIKMLGGGSKRVVASGASSVTPGSRMLLVYNFLAETFTDNLNLFKLVQYIEKSKIAHKLHSFSQHFEGSVKINKPSHKAPVTSPTSSTSSFLAKLSASKQTPAKQTQAKSKENVKPEMTKTKEQQQEEEGEEVVMGSPLMQVTELLRALQHPTADGRVLVTVGSQPRHSSIKYLLLNPASHFQDIVTQCRSVVVAGGTMQPISEFKNQLFLSAGGEESRVQYFSCGHVVPAKQLLPVTLPQGPTGQILDFTYHNRTDPKVLDELGRVLVNVCTVVPGGVVCFLPSYDYEDKLQAHFTSSGILTRLSAKKKVFWEPRKANQLDAVLSDYAKTIKLTASNTSGMSGSLLLSVVGGKMSEGINFSDELGRCVVMVGLPYPNTHSPELKEKMLYLNKNVSAGQDGKASGSVFYENLCFKAVNQSIGRAIRHKQDYASILLLDHRYSRPASIQALPGWISKHLRVTTKFPEAFGLLRKFFVEKRAEGTVS
ncbi:ATP-dependent DNA helicase DDX11-like [Portunus trituberculatus]|uniref:ATP-dependent DNA helicase DDX11-like n=1 Tax=Portunus trituberculatus TaxID=210409 RepID=UPI001E1CCB80|nr:ATP-dependent DNA helicase DDX11-like [Portunus trituberculatus]XP_045108857.1 ATP-dependent DNA helicase DDX11-like [Portunus trituberculatus]